LRGLDSIEDDTAVAGDVRIKELSVFAQHIQNQGWTLSGYGRNANEILLLEHFDKVIDLYVQLKPAYRSVITEVTNEMSKGMIECISNNYAMDTVDQYDTYCHYVAGLVGIGLTKIFAASGLEKDATKLMGAEMERLANSMGLFLQKVNIIRDYMEDLDEQRVFWPKTIWGKHTSNLADFALPENVNKGVECVKELVLNALRHIPDVFKYLSMIDNPSNFRFCSIPQAMAIATLCECVCNPLLFYSATKPVKIRTGLSCLIVVSAKDIDSTVALFYRFLRDMADKVSASSSSHSSPLDEELLKTIRALLPEYRSTNNNIIIIDNTTASLAAFQVATSVLVTGAILLK